MYNALLVLGLVGMSGVGIWSAAALLLGKTGAVGALAATLMASLVEPQTDAALLTGAIPPMPPAPSGRPKPDLPSAIAQPAPRRDFTILQIGDSHTAADFFTGRVRELLADRFGAGGLYLPPGVPQSGVRSAMLAIEASDAWAYQSMARSTEKDHFWLSGYTAMAARADARISFRAKTPVRFDAIDVSFLAAPGGGTAEILLDGEPVDTVRLDGPEGAPVIRRLLPQEVQSFETLSIRSASADKVQFTGVFVDKSSPGVSYLSVGFPGARVNILNRLAPQNLADDITRIAPDMVVLAFGTNEAFDDNLDLARYRTAFAGIAQSILAARPGVELVIVGPPPSARRQHSCSASALSCGGAVAVSGSCWAEPPHLSDVRAVQREVAGELGATFWDWASVLPSSCDLQQGRLGEPALYSADRIHLTQAGYRQTAGTFAEFLAPLIDQALGAR